MGSIFKGIAQKKKGETQTLPPLPTPEQITSDKLYADLERVYNNATLLFNYIKASEGPSNEYPEIWKKRWQQSHNLLFTADRENTEIAEAKIEGTKKYILELACLDLRNVCAFLIFVINRMRTSQHKSGLSKQMLRSTADKARRSGK